MATRLVVEWTRSSLRLAVAEGSGTHWRLKALHSQATGDVTEALRALLKSTKVTAQQVIGVMSREQVITRVVKFPSVQPAELAQMAELYAKAQLPYPREQTVMDFHVLSQAAGFSTVAIVACQRDLIDRQLAVLRNAGLAVGMLTISSWGVLGWYQRLAASSASREPSLIVNIDDTRTDLVLVAKGKILSSRSIGQGVQDWELVSGDTAELLALEVERSRASIRKELPGDEVRSLILTGVGALAQWSQQLSTRLQLPTVAISAGDAYKGVALPSAFAISPVVIGGLASSDLRGVLNLSPQEVRVQVRHRQQVKELILISVLLIGVLALGSSFLTLQMVRQRLVATRMDQVLATIEPTAKAIQEKTHAAKLVGGILKERKQLATILAGIFRETPPSIALEALTFEHVRQEISVRGGAPTTQEVLNYIKQLGQLQGIGSVDLKYSTQRSTPSGERIDFELALRQQGNGS